jgi:hypothetical protein
MGAQIAVSEPNGQESQHFWCIHQDGPGQGQELFGQGHFDG